MRRAALVGPALYLALSIGLTWPLITDPTDLSIARHFDTYAVTWVQHAATTLDLSLHTAASSWPFGESLARADSFVYLLLVYVFGLFGAANWASAACALLGPPISAWAAERLARTHMGAKAPWSLIAGVAFGFSGLTVTAWLEGHVYVLLLPWLPLLAGALFDATEPNARPRSGVMAALWWTLCLLTTAYAGIAATALAAVVLLSRGRPALTPALRWAAALVLVVGVLYAGAFAHSGAATRVQSAHDRTSASDRMMAGAASPVSLAAWRPDADDVHHSHTHYVGFAAVALALLVPWVRRRPWTTTAALAMGGAGLLLSLGPRVEIAPGVFLPGLLWPLAQFEASGFLRFPARFLWLSTLGFGLAAAATLTRIGARRPALAWPLLMAAILDIALFTGMPWRAGQTHVDAPEGYLQTPEDRAVLELFPFFYGTRGDHDFFASKLTCAYQRTHQRPILNHCLPTTTDASPRAQLAAEVLTALLERRPGPALAERLQGLGVGAVVLHAGMFEPADRALLRSRGDHAFGEPATDSTQGGEHLVFWHLPGDGPADRAEAQASWLADPPS